MLVVSGKGTEARSMMIIYALAEGRIVKPELPSPKPNGLWKDEDTGTGIAREVVVDDG